MTRPDYHRYSKYRGLYQRVKASVVEPAADVCNCCKRIKIGEHSDPIDDYHVG